MIKRKLCVPCREALRETHNIEPVMSGAEKDTCYKCKRRRYCNSYKIERKGKK